MGEKRRKKKRRSPLKSYSLCLTTTSAVQSYRASQKLFGVFPGNSHHQWATCSPLGTQARVPQPHPRYPPHSAIPLAEYPLVVQSHNRLSLLLTVSGTQWVWIHHSGAVLHISNLIFFFTLNIPLYIPYCCLSLSYFLIYHCNFVFICSVMLYLAYSGWKYMNSIFPNPYSQFHTHCTYWTSS